MAFLQELNGDQVFPLHPRLTVIGRDPSCDIAIGLGQASWRHAMIVTSTGGEHYVEDLQSRNGTFVNGKRIGQRTLLAPGDHLEVPGLIVTYQADEAGGPRLSPSVASTAEQPTMTGRPHIDLSLDLAVGPRPEVAPEGKLRAVLEISRTLGHALALDEVLPKLLESLFRIFPQANRGFILLRDPATGQLALKAQRGATEGAPQAISRTIIDHALATRQAIVSTDTGQDGRFSATESVRQWSLRSIMCVPMISHAGLPLGAIQVATADYRRPFQQDDLDVLMCASTQVAREIELARLHADQRDLEDATRIQQGFLPDQLPRVEGLRFFNHYKPALRVGGDYYDYIRLPGDRLAVTVGDVAGKGVPAALLMAQLAAATRFCLASVPSVPEAVHQLNSSLAKALGTDRFITFLVAVLDCTRFTLTLVNAGHLFPLLRRAGRGAVESLGEETAGLPLGFGAPYEEETLALEPGDSVILFSDGVSEAHNPKGEMYGEDRLRAAVQRAPEAVDGLGQAILADVRDFAAGRPQHDDMTLVCFGRSREPGSA